MPKFVATDQSVEDLISNLKSKNKQEDARKLLEIYEAICKIDPQVWYPGIIGFGNYHYKSKTGIEGDSPLLAFAPRQAKISLYIDPYFPRMAEYLKRLGKHKLAVGCVYVNKLADIDLEVLNAMLRDLLVYNKGKIQGEA